MDEAKKIIDNLDHSMECVMESDKRTLRNPESADGWLFDIIHEWRKELDRLSQLIS